jgi:single-strand DNA-binding protein
LPPHQLCIVETKQRQLLQTRVHFLTNKTYTQMNTVKFIGNVGKEVVVKQTANNSKLATFSLATNEKYTDRNNQEVQNTTWHNVIAWGKTAEACEKLLSKGKFVSVEGKIVYRQYENSNNQKVNITEIVAYKVGEVTPKN